MKNSNTVKTTPFTNIIERNGNRIIHFHGDKNYLLKKAREFHSGGNLQLSSTLLLALDQNHPNDPLIIENLVKVMLELSQFQLARERAEQLVQLQPQSSLPRLLLGLACQGLGENSKALNALDQALSLRPVDNESIASLVGLAILLNARLPEVEDITRTVTDKEPGCQFTRHFYASVLLHQGKFAEAKRNFQMYPCY